MRRIYTHWIHEHQDGPNFTWDSEKLLPKLIEIRHRQGRLLGKMEGPGFDLQKEVHLKTLTHDVVKSSSIEGVRLLRHLLPTCCSAWRRKFL